MYRIEVELEIGILEVKTRKRRVDFLNGNGVVMGRHLERKIDNSLNVLDGTIFVKLLVNAEHEMSEKLPDFELLNMDDGGVNPK